jgi:hypothetical protein
VLPGGVPLLDQASLIAGQARASALPPALLIVAQPRAARNEAGGGKDEQRSLERIERADDHADDADCEEQTGPSASPCHLTSIVRAA